MSWCPICKSEYIEGKIECAECKVSLVETLEEQQSSSEIEEAPLLNQVEGYDNKELEEEIKKNKEPSIVYQKKSEQADNHKSSGFTLVVVGIVGLIVLILYLFDLIPFLIGYSNKILLTGVMGSVFLFLIYMGIYSLKAFKKLMRESDIENNLEKEIKNWCTSTITIQLVDQAIEHIEIMEVEELYFKRIEEIKLIISSKFMNLEEGFLDKIADDYYSEIFE